METKSLDEYLSRSKAQSWLKGYARQVARGQKAFAYDDLFQEGAVAMWQAFSSVDQQRPGSVDSYLIQAAKWRILQLLDGKSLFGGTATLWRGTKTQKKLRWHEAENSYDHRVMGEWDEVAETDAQLDEEDWRSRVREAVSGLTDTQRERIYRKFWLDEAVYTSGRWWYDPKYGARAILQSELADLKRTS